jgi:tetratricopeptide (TPR) repeat protein
MRRESIVALISGTFFGILVGWILGSQQAGPAVPTGAPVASTAGAPESSGPPPLVLQRAGDLEKTATAQPQNAAVRVELANLYYDAQRFDLAAPWYEAALKLNPNNVEASTDLAVAYYNQNQADRALQQIDHSLAVDPKHTKTLLNQGIIRAFGKRDLAGAVQSWQKVVDIAPNSEDGAQARRAIQDVQANHPGTSGRGGTRP